MEQEKIIYESDCVIFKLDFPFSFKPSKMDPEKTLEELRLPKSVKGKHMKKMDQAPGEMGKSMALLAALAGLPPTAIDEMDSRDVADALEVIKPFLPASLQTGSEQSAV
ncbi:phage tail assembly protein [Desulfonatronovibrio hydrogenovorans]|uniref:phage tail assembly protein n=1 Tax=Desulfonatronovibrio hydrogenovorans TaxID=53245 RepID=UPI0004901FC0|nr:phage tail assembly protein [Desulfonatronovibrio hydrogenovorans]